VKNDREDRLKVALFGKEKELVALQQELAYQFNDIGLLLRAVTHRSFVFEHSQNKVLMDNETFEFLGDAVLDLVVSKMLIEAYPKMDEGELTKIRSSLVQEKHLALLSREISLADSLLLGKGERLSGGADKDSILSCAFEAVIGAVFQDGGYEAARRVLEDKYRSRLEYGRREAVNDDPKSRLQELTQKLTNEAPIYNLVSESGPDHNKSFTISVQFKGATLATATAKSKKAAEQKAAAKAVSEF